MSLTVLPGNSHDERSYFLDSASTEALWRAEDRHFWWAARSAWVLRALRHHGMPASGRVLEVGCGSGAVALALQRAGYRVTGVDTAEWLVRKAYERCPEADFVAGDVSDLPSALHGPYDCVALFDVLEHCEAPEALLRASLRWAKPGALVAISVPGMRSLHSVIDDVSGHRQRYDPGEPSGLLARSGVVEPVEYGVFRSLRMALRLRRPRGASAAALDRDARQRLLREDLALPPAPVNAALRWLCGLERVLAFRFSRGARGSSLLALGRVPQEFTCD